jgi:hypothetical protein
MIPFEKSMEHKVSEVICVKCVNRWICARPIGVLLKDIECQRCGCGYVIETSQDI